jgi:hypothetical protein
MSPRFGSTEGVLFSIRKSDRRASFQNPAGVSNMDYTIFRIVYSCIYVTSLTTYRQARCAIQRSNKSTNFNKKLLRRRDRLLASWRVLHYFLLQGQLLFHQPDYDLALLMQQQRLQDSLIITPFCEFPVNSLYGGNFRNGPFKSL